MDNFLDKKNAAFFYCETCDFKCCKLSNWNTHLTTRKHKLSHKWITMDNESAGNNAEEKTYACQCGKNYKYSSGLSKHKHKCSVSKSHTINEVDISNDFNDISDKDLIMMLIKENKELMKSMVDMSKNNQQINCNNTILNTNSNNSFNLHFYLNETCKNAMNISDFVNNIKLSLNDLEYTGRQGYVAGISNIILNNLRSIETNERPIHCSDLKRETLYIKSDDIWEKDNENKDKLTKAIKNIAFENIKKINEWKSKYPDCTNPDSRKNDIYLNIVSNSMCGLTKEETSKNISKIITNIAKEVVIQKL